jgi:Zn-dependent protease with chaperone function
MASTEKRFFAGISPREWEHPADRAALAALAQVPGMQDIVKFLSGITGEKQLRLLFLASAVRVSEKQFSRVHTLTQEACSILDAEHVPEVYVTQTPLLNAGAIGVDHPFISINSGLAESLEDEELLAVIGHEMGHIVSGHMLFRTILFILLNISLATVPLPIGQLGLLAIRAALLEWFRKSEFSCDRAGLLTVQDPEVSQRVLMKLAGGSQIDQMSIDEFVEQAEEYDSYGNVIDGVYKLMNLMGQTHPFAALRLAQLKSWVESGDYEKIVGGEYRRRDADEKEDVQKEFDEAFKTYREEMRTSNDPLNKVFSRVADGAETFTKQAESVFRSIFEQGRK